MVIATAIAIVIAIVIVYPSGIREINSQGPPWPNHVSTD